MFYTSSDEKWRISYDWRMSTSWTKSSVTTRDCPYEHDPKWYRWGGYGWAHDSQMEVKAAVCQYEVLVHFETYDASPQVSRRGLYTRQGEMSNRPYYKQKGGKNYFYWCSANNEWQISENKDTCAAGILGTGGFCPDQGGSWKYWAGRRWQNLGCRMVVMSDCYDSVYIQGLRNLDLESGRRRRAWQSCSSSYGCYYSFEKTSIRKGNRPIYKCSNSKCYGYHLFFWEGDERWRVGTDYSKPSDSILRSTDDSRICPYSATNWQYRSGSTWHSVPGYWKISH